MPKRFHKVMKDAPGQGALFGLQPQVKPLDADTEVQVRRHDHQTESTVEKSTGERFVPPVNWIEDDADS